jgi:SAM-dependent methyltransferase
MATGWEAMWSNGGGLQPGQAFDAEVPAPILVNLTTSGEISGKAALVPGCGRGYAVTQLATAYESVIGLDIAPTAVQSAQERLASLPETIQSRCTFSTDDFFGFSGQFDCIYDYTFLCAIQPEQREAWAQKHASLLSPSGVLLVMIFPICNKQGGPPFAMSPELVRSLLEPAGLVEIDCKILSSEEAHNGRDGNGPMKMKTALSRWRLK